MSTTEDSDTVSAMDLAAFIGLSRNRIAELAARGHVVRTSHGTYSLKKSVQAYTRYLRSRYEGPRVATHASSTRQRLDEAKARLLETEVEQAEGEWLPIEMLIQSNAVIHAVVREKLVGLAAKVPPAAVSSTRAAVDEALAELDDNAPEKIVARIAAQAAEERCR